MPRDSAAAISVPAAHAGRHFGLLTIWALGCALLIAGLHLATAGYGIRLGPYRSGIATTAAFALAAIYSLRKRLIWVSLHTMRVAARMPPAIAHRLLVADRLESWRFAHVLIGVGVLIPLWWHIGQGTGATRLEAALLAATVLLMLSGFAGAAIQDFLPHTMRIRPNQEVRPEDVDAAIHELYVEAEEAILGHSEALVRTYLAAIRPVLLGSRRTRAMLLATLSGADPAAAVGARLRARGAQLPGEAEPWERLVSIADRKVRLEHNHFNLSLSVGWLRIHIALAISIGILTAFHVAGALYFAGL
ncbi:MAG TPA: hypothetical protein VFE56_06290 [Candidatus Binataceae bacterium]|jgi:hypothetical protein|nr:hypothetical protein [Candidatus Binataceae bacterium]